MGVSTRYWQRWFLFLCIPLLLAGLLLPPALAVGATLLPAQPLQSFLKADGTLDLPAGFRGSLDPRGSGGQGWQLVSGPNEAPRFAPAVRSLAGSPDRS